MGARNSRRRPGVGGGLGGGGGGRRGGRRRGRNRGRGGQDQGGAPNWDNNNNPGYQAAGTYEGPPPGWETDPLPFDQDGAPPDQAMTAAAQAGGPAVQPQQQPAFGAGVAVAGFSVTFAVTAGALPTRLKRVRNFRAMLGDVVSAAPPR